MNIHTNKHKVNIRVSRKQGHRRDWFSWGYSNKQYKNIKRILNAEDTKE